MFASAAALVSALAPGPSYADGASPHAGLTAATSVRAGAGEAARAGPLNLVRPLASDTVERAFLEAESLYRGRQIPQAMQAYATLVELDPTNARAWLRLGNLHQRAGHEAYALEAYRLAAHSVSRTDAETEARGKALLNIALIGLAQAARAIDDLDALDVAALDGARDGVESQLAGQRRRALRASGRWPDAEATAAPAQSTPAPSLPGAAPPAARAPSARAVPVDARTTPPAAEVEPVEPYTVDRWIARVRRASSARDPVGRGVLAEPVTESPLPALPAVETFRGVTGAPRR